MKVLVFTDLHGSDQAYKELKKKAKEVDVILCCGDMTVFEHKLKNIMKDISKLGKPVYLVHGNHEEAPNVKEECKKYENLHFIHKKKVKVGEWELYGFGGGGFSFESLAFKEFISDKKIGKKAVLIVHQPPYNTEVDLVWDEHAGNKTFKKYLSKFNYCFSGHIHETAGVVEKVGKTTVANAGPDGMIFELE